MLSLAAMRAWRLPRVTMLIQYLYRDEVVLSRFQTGLVFADDRPKPSLQAFKLPFAQMRRHGYQAVVWGQIRDGRPGRKPYRLEVLHKNAWKAVGHDRLTNDAGVFIRTIRLKRGALLRVWSPRPASASVSSCGSDDHALVVGTLALGGRGHSLVGQEDVVDGCVGEVADGLDERAAGVVGRRTCPSPCGGCNPAQARRAAGRCARLLIRRHPAP